MNFDESSRPNGSITSMPDYSYTPGDFQNFSGVKSPGAHSPSNRSPNDSLEQKKSRSQLSPTNKRSMKKSSHRNASRDNSIEENSSNLGGLRERRAQGRGDNHGQERSRRDSMNRSSNNQTHIGSLANDESLEIEVDRSYKSFLKLKKLYVHYIFNFICFFVMGLNVYFAYSTDQIHFSVLENIESQFNSHLVIDINLADKFSQCNGLYSDAQMGKLPGYDYLCQCADTLTPGSCSIQQRSKNCRTVEHLAATKVTYWNERKICMRRSEGSIKEAYQKLSTNNAGDGVCDGELKKCIVSSNGNSLCMGRFEFCPVTKILVENTAVSENSGKKWKGQLHLPNNKTFLFENEENKGTSLLDFGIGEDNCSQIEDRFVREKCDAKSSLLDRLPESQIWKENYFEHDKFKSFEGLNNSIALYTKQADFLEMCKFNKTFNPIVLSTELDNWNKVKTLRFVNPFFICCLIVLSYVRTSVIDYLNTRTSARTLLRRKKEIYSIFGFFTGSSVMITCQILIILYYIFWGYLLLNQSRLIGQRWLDMACITPEVRHDTEKMMQEISKVEAFNMVTIGPMIICCILEALFAQYKMIDLDIINQLRD